MTERVAYFSLLHQHMRERLKVYSGEGWIWVNYPTKYSCYFEQRRTEQAWEQQSPKLILQRNSAELHFPQMKAIKPNRVRESKHHPDLSFGQLLTPRTDTK